jgi:GntR family transcriptional regulator, transcriptional repressor for pyruvate dehydrogenase complex
LTRLFPFVHNRSDVRPIQGKPGLVRSIADLSRLPVADRADEVARALTAFIDDAKLQPGHRLPTERQLMEALGVGRSTVREAISRFQALGVVDVRKGSGIYLRRAVSADSIHVPLTLTAGAALRDRLLQTLEVRRGLEVEAGAVAALRATAADLAEIEQRLRVMESVQTEKGTAGPEDLAFHLAIYDATHNPLFRQLLEQIRDAFESFFEKPFDRPDFARRSFPFHRQLYHAIRTRDADAARAKTRAILAVVEEDIEAMSP